MDSPENPDRKPAIRKRVLIALVLLFVVAGAAWYGSTRVLGVAEVSTDNANVNGNQILLMPQVSGTVATKLPLLPTRSQYFAKRRSRCIIEKSISRLCKIS